MKATTLGANSIHINFEVTTIATCDNKIVVIGTECNPSTNNYIVINRNIRRATTHFMYNIESNNDLIWNKHKTYYITNKTNCSINKADYSIDKTNSSIDRTNYSTNKSYL